MYSVKKLLVWICLTISYTTALKKYIHESNLDTVRISRDVSNSHAFRNSRCLLPEYPKNGMYFVYGSEETFSPGMLISDQEVLIVECNDGYRLYGVDHILCESGTWSYPFGQCLIPNGNQKCVLPEHPKNGEWVFYRASITYYPGNETSDVSVLHVKCNDGYALEGINIISCINGTWSPPIGKCLKLPSDLLSVPDRNGSCVLPEHPKNGEWSVYGSLETYSPGDKIGSKEVLSVICNTGSALNGNKFIVCLNGTWSSPIGTCPKMCPPRNSTGSLIVTCLYNNAPLPDCTRPLDGTVAEVKCAPFYKDHILGTRSFFQTCINGSWSGGIPKCVPACGVKSPAALRVKRVINGTNVQKGDYPWQVALYTKADKQLICGGTLISQRIILTAAHCITKTSGELLPKENYIVAVGKYYRKYDDNRDKNDSQFSKLQECFIPKEYKGAIQNYLGDIAILVTVKTFTVSSKIQPVCVDWFSSYDTRDEYGYTTGWGFTSENDNPSEVLKEVRLPLIAQEKCEQDFPEDYQIYLTTDKFCAGYLDSGTAICRGDSGGGLVVKRDNNGLYFIVGIQSLSPQSPSPYGGCDKDQYSLYTNVQQHIAFILNIYNSFHHSNT